jgi:hypothetical protein
MGCRHMSYLYSLYIFSSLRDRRTSAGILPAAFLLCSPISYNSPVRKAEGLCKRSGCAKPNLGCWCCSQVIKRFILHAKKTAFIVEHDFIMATYLADRVVVYEGVPARDAKALSYVPCCLQLELLPEICFASICNIFCRSPLRAHVWRL